MFKLGEKQILQVEKKVPMGVFLIDPEEPQAPAGEQNASESSPVYVTQRRTPRSEEYNTSAVQDTTGGWPDSATREGRYNRYGSGSWNSADRRGYTSTYTKGGSGRRFNTRRDSMPFHVLLPGSQVPEGTEPGDSLEVFLYRDSEDRLIATRKEPKLTLHEVGYLTVKEVGRIGAFMDWGLDKDLLLPFHEQPRDRVQKGQECLVAVYIDKSGRLCATMNVYPYLRKDSPYHAGDEVDGTAYQTSDNFGTFVAVDDIYSALIPRKELVEDIPVGAKVHARVTGVKPDGKLDLSLRDNSYNQTLADAEQLLARMQENGGLLPFNDKADPELIREELHMSKNEFKRAVGHLLKEGQIEIGEDSITLRQE